jgi:tetratricopeptide (TPR) repeat protein
LRAGFKHQWQDAEKYARIAVGIAPERAETHYYLGDAIGYLSPDNPEALRELDRADERTRDREFLATILSRKGELLAAQGKEHDALDLFDRARQIAPRDARPRIGYAMVLLRLDPSAEQQAVEILMQVVNDAPWTISAHLALARMAESRGDLPSAETWYRAALARDANNPDALFALGQFYTRQNRASDAKQMLTLALKHEPHVDDQQAITRALAELDAR